MSNVQPKAPFIAHSLFPVVVAVWFAALLGAGFLVLPEALLARIVGATGIAALIPAAAPPLGTKAALIISGTAALFGAIIGYVLARQLAAMRGRVSAPEDLDRRLRRKTPDAEARRPISAMDEFDLAAFDAPLTPEPRSRRFVPKPELAEPEIESFPSEAVIAESAEWPEPESTQNEWFQPEWATPEHEEPPVETRIAFNAPYSAQEAELPKAAVEWPEVSLPEATETEIVRAVEWPDAIEAEYEAEEQTAGGREAAEQADHFADIPPAAAFTPEIHRQSTPHPAPVRVPFEGVPLEQLGMVQLTERLGISLQKRLERNRGVMPPPPPGLATILGRPELEPRPAPAAPKFEQPEAEAPATQLTTQPAPEAIAPVIVPASEPEPTAPEAFAPAPFAPVNIRPVLVPDPAPAFETEAEAEPDFTPPSSFTPTFAPDPVTDSPASWPLVAPETNRTPTSLRLLAYELDDFGEDELEEEEDETAEVSYSSLIGMKTPPRPENPPMPSEFIPENFAENQADNSDRNSGAESADLPSASISRPFDSPLASAPQQVPSQQSDRQDTEQALRSALTRLQGLSGAA